MSALSLRTLAIRLLPVAVAVLAGTAPVDAQLKTTPWPTFQADLRHTGRGPNLGPLFPSGAPGPGDVKTLRVGDKVKSQPVIDVDGTIYIGSGWSFCAIKPAASTASGEMEVKWCTRLRADNSTGVSASIDINDYLYFADRDNTMTAFEPDFGSIVCRYNYGFEGDIKTTVAINPVNGRLYFAPLQNFYGPGPLTATPPAPNCNFADEIWNYPNPTNAYIGTSHPAVVIEGGKHMIYIGDAGGYLHKYRDDGPVATHLWQVNLGSKISAAPTIGDDGTIYIGSNQGLHAVRPLGPNDPLGAVIWTFPTRGWADQAAALGPDGTLYVGAKSGKTKSFYAVNPNGTLKWEFGPTFSDADIGTFPAVGADGLVYAVIATKIYAFDGATGNVLWSYQLNGYPINHPSIGGTATPFQAGTAILYVATGSAGTLYAISSPRSASALNRPPQADAGGVQSVTVGQTVQFNALGSSDLDGDPITFSWDFGDGFTATGPSPTHTYWTAGDKTVTLTASDVISTGTDTTTIQVAATGSSAPLSDNFNRGNTSVLGNGWVEQPGSDLLIFNSEVRNAAVKANHIATRPDLVGGDMTAAASFASVNNNWGPRFGVILRQQGPGNYYLFYRQAGGSNALRIVKVVGGVETVLDSLGFSNLATNTFFRIQATAIGQDLKLFLNGVEKVSVQDTTYSGGTAGILIGAGSSSVYQHRADNFCAALGTSCTVAP